MSTMQDFSRFDCPCSNSILNKQQQFMDGCLKVNEGADFLATQNNIQQPFLVPELQNNAPQIMITDSPLIANNSMISVDSSPPTFPMEQFYPQFNSCWTMDKQTTPENTEFNGDYEFHLSRDHYPTKEAKSTATLTYSPFLKKLFVKKEHDCPFKFSTSSPPPQGSIIKICAVYKEESHVLHHPVVRRYEESENNIAERYHFIRLIHNKQARYSKYLENNHLYVEIPFTGPSTGGEFQTELLNFQFYNSEGRKSKPKQRIDVIFTLENCCEILGRQVMEVCVRASTGRDRKQMERKLQKERSKGRCGDNSEIPPKRSMYGEIKEGTSRNIALEEKIRQLEEKTFQQEEKIRQLEEKTFQLEEKTTKTNNQLEKEQKVSSSTSKLEENEDKQAFYVSPAVNLPKEKQIFNLTDPEEFWGFTDQNFCLTFQD